MLTTSEQESPTNILVVAVTRMGDLLQASPTIVGLKNQYPNAKTTVLVDKQFASICRGIPCIDELYEIDLAMIVRALERDGEGVVDAYRYTSEIVDDLRSRNYDYCLNMASAGYTSLLLKLLDIKNSRGWTADEHGHRLISTPWSMLFAAFVYHGNRYFNSINLVDTLRCAAGVDQHPRTLVYNVAEEYLPFADQFLAEKGLGDETGGPLVCLQAGASQGKRQWSTDKFAALTKLLVEDLGARVVLTGSDTELPIIERIVKAYQSERVAVACGATNLGQLGSLLKKADILVTGDTGPMHMAVSVGTPVVALFLASAFCYETGPYSEGNLVIQPQISCNPCNPNYKCARPDCHDQVTPELVSFLTKARLRTPMGQIPSLEDGKQWMSPNSVGVFYSEFDEDGFLDFRRINAAADRDGYHQGFHEAARNAYKDLWKEEFGIRNTVPATPPYVNGKLRVIDNRDEAADGIAKAIAMAGEGSAAVEQLIELIKDEKSDLQRLGQTGQLLEHINSNIEELGLSHPVLGAIVRMFVMENQNMRGDDPLVLASELRELYRSLHRRSEKFSTLFSSYVGGYQG